MKKLSLVVVLSIVAILFTTSCGETVKQSPDDMQAGIESLQKELFSDNTKALDISKADSMINLYLDFANTYPEDSMALEFLFKAAEVQMGINKGMECIATLSKIQNTYPDAKIMPMVLHFKAFVYDDKIQDFDKARACLDELIENYPEDNLVPNAKAYREMIGKDPNEMFMNADAVAEGDSL